MSAARRAARLGRVLMLGLLFWLGAVAGVAAQATTRAIQTLPTTAPSAQQVLVLLRLPPKHFHVDPSFTGAYGGGADRTARQRVANRLAREHGLTLVTGWPMPLVGVDCFVMAVPADRSPVEVAASLSHEREVAWSEPMQTYRAQGTAAAPNDPLFRLQPAARDWRLADLHEIATGRNVRVAVVDSMVDTAHPDLAGQAVISRNFVSDHPAAPEQHGTGVAGIIAALADNQIGIVGVAPGARLMALRACWQEQGSIETACNTLSLAEALHFAIDHDAQVINLSLAGPPDLLLGKLLDVAIARGAVVVGAVDPNLPRGGFPASHPGVVAVANEPAAARAGIYLAPGHDVPTTEPGGRWFLVNGSSYSAAHVSGLFALLREHSVRPMTSAALVATAGTGVIDTCATLLQGAGPCNGCACARPRSAATARP